MSQAALTSEAIRPRRPSSPSHSRPKPLEFALFAGVPAVLTCIAIAVFASIHSFAGDFHKEFWPAAWRVLHGHSPYLLGRAQIDNGVAFPYPALAGVALTPFALIARGPSEVLFTIVCFGCLFGILRTLEVSDWRIYGIVLLWAPVINAWQSANLTLLLGLATALMWRHRDRPAVAGLCAAAAVSLKPFVWPLGLWLLATRRFRAAAWAFAWGLLLNLASWAVLGFGQIGRYLHDAKLVSSAFFRSAYTPAALASHLGAGAGVAEVVGVAVALAGIVACVLAGSRRRELACLTLAIVVMWLASPVLWMHYFALALVPLAIARPRLAPVWALPLVLIICGSRSSGAWQIVLVFAVFGTLVAACLRSAAGSAQPRQAVA